MGHGPASGDSTPFLLASFGAGREEDLHGRAEHLARRIAAAPETRHLPLHRLLRDAQQTATEAVTDHPSGISAPLRRRSLTTSKGGSTLRQGVADHADGRVRPLANRSWSFGAEGWAPDKAGR